MNTYSTYGYIYEPLLVVRTSKEHQPYERGWYHAQIRYPYWNSPQGRRGIAPLLVMLLTERDWGSLYCPRIYTFPSDLCIKSGSLLCRDSGGVSRSPHHHPSYDEGRTSVCSTLFDRLVRPKWYLYQWYTFKVLQQYPVYSEWGEQFFNCSFLGHKLQYVQVRRS